MLNIAKSIFDALSANPELTYHLSGYGGGPSIFTSTKIPPDAPRPYLWTPGNLADVDDDAIDVSLRQILRDIGCYADATNSDELVDTIAELVRQTLHGQTFTLTGGSLLLCRCSGPVVAPTDRTLVGRIVTASLLLYTT